MTTVKMSTYPLGGWHSGARHRNRQRGRLRRRTGSGRIMRLATVITAASDARGGPATRAAVQSGDRFVLLAARDLSELLGLPAGAKQAAGRRGSGRQPVRRVHRGRRRPVRHRAAAPVQGHLLRPELRGPHRGNGPGAAGIPHAVRQVRGHPDRRRRRHRRRRARRPAGLGSGTGGRRRRPAQECLAGGSLRRDRRLHRGERHLPARLAEPHPAVVPGQGLRPHHPARVPCW